MLQSFVTVQAVQVDFPIDPTGQTIGGAGVRGDGVGGAGVGGDGVGGAGVDGDGVIFPFRGSTEGCQP